MAIATTIPSPELVEFGAPEGAGPHGAPPPGPGHWQQPPEWRDDDHADASLPVAPDLAARPLPPCGPAPARPLPRLRPLAWHAEAAFTLANLVREGPNWASGRPVAMISGERLPDTQLSGPVCTSECHRPTDVARLWTLFRSRPQPIPAAFSPRCREQARQERKIKR